MLLLRHYRTRDRIRPACAHAGSLVYARSPLRLLGVDRRQRTNAVSPACAPGRCRKGYTVYYTACRHICGRRYSSLQSNEHVTTHYSRRSGLKTFSPLTFDTLLQRTNFLTCEHHSHLQSPGSTTFQWHNATFFNNKLTNPCFYSNCSLLNEQILHFHPLGYFIPNPIIVHY